MKQITLACLVIALMASNPVWARGGYGHYNGGWGGHYGGRPYYGNGWGGYYGNRGYYGHGGYYNGAGLALGLGLGYGLGYYGGSYYSPYYNYPQTVITVPATPPVYIQQQAAPVVQQNPSGYWYYCNNPQGYYPYVKQCSNGWQQVSPTPPR